MSAENIISFIIYLICACIMFAIGFSQLRSKKPVGFYSGEQPPTEDVLTDIHSWNVKHGAMWVVYGFIIIISYINNSFCAGDSVWAIVLSCGGIIIPLIIMVWYHHKLIQKYKR